MFVIVVKEHTYLDFGKKSNGTEREKKTRNELTCLFQSQSWDRFDFSEVGG